MKAIKLLFILLISSTAANAGREEIYVVETTTEFGKSPLLVYVEENTQGMNFFSIYLREVDYTCSRLEVSLSVDGETSDFYFFGALQKERMKFHKNVWEIRFQVSSACLDRSALRISRIYEYQGYTRSIVHIYHLQDLRKWASMFDRSKLPPSGDERIDKLCERESSFYHEWIEGIGTEWLDYKRKTHSPRDAEAGGGSR